MARRRLHRDVAHPPYALTPQGHQTIQAAACEDASAITDSIQSYFLGFGRSVNRAVRALIWFSGPRLFGLIGPGISFALAS